ncbi:hypothetical protein [Burkholderia cepacia]|uniref:hypothetical protein n=1 Tax=Burkholderia cepacia TaxID=292 RepID=UPI000F5B2914|nr:hypothetical protein [Burkholderia cepacia]RQT74781.1 hypothetical protein DF029_07420 [Burkholderia cepacia]
MNEKQISDALQSIYAELEMQRARGDVLLYALQSVIESTPNPRAVLKKTLRRLDGTEGHALYSPESSDAYVVAFGAAKGRFEKWLEALPPAGR